MEFEEQTTTVLVTAERAGSEETELVLAGGLLVDESVWAVLLVVDDLLGVDVAVLEELMSEALDGYRPHDISYNVYEKRKHHKHNLVTSQC